ncbi:MAG: SDR family oxidoreductase [Pseudomonadales bacterium]|nr:SDR family oxidoreductase [Pseudomonadales bacterium]
MGSDESSVAVVTGTSTGIGFAAALELARQGHKVFAGMRDTNKAQPLATASEQEDLDITIVALDVTSAASTDAAFVQIHRAGPVSVLVNNAGIGGATPLELTPEDEHRAIFETNYFGAVRCIQAVLPEMRERCQGTIVNITSMEGLVAMPNQIPYSATKWALECLGEGLAHEVFRFNIRVVNIEPGVIMTQIFDNSTAATRYDRESPYQPIMRRNGKMFKAGFEANVQPERVAETIIDAISSPEYRLRWPVGEDAVGMFKGRRAINDEDWIEMGADLSDEDYNRRYEEYFGVRLS